MPRINLLPWREAERKERQKNFGIASLLALVVGLLVIWGVNTYLQGMIDYQNSRNQRLQQEIASLDEQIASRRTEASVATSTSERKGPRALMGRVGSRSATFSENVISVAPSMLMWLSS